MLLLVKNCSWELLRATHIECTRIKGFYLEGLYRVCNKRIPIEWRNVEIEAVWSFVKTKHKLELTDASNFYTNNYISQVRRSFWNYCWCCLHLEIKSQDVPVALHFFSSFKIGFCSFAVSLKPYPSSFKTESWSREKEFTFRRFFWFKVSPPE